MKRVLTAFLVVVVLGIIGYGAVQVYQRVQERKKTVEADAKEQAPMTVAVRRVETATLTRTVNVTGGIEARAVVDVIPKVGGTLERLRLPNGKPIEEGTMVEKGEVVAVIEHSALEAAVKAAEAALMQAKVQARPAVIEAKIEQAKAAAAAAKRQLADLEATLRDLEKRKDRVVELFKGGVVSPDERDQVVAAYEAMLEKTKAQREQVSRAESAAVLAEVQTRDMAEAAVLQAEAALRQAQISLDDATVEAPLSGVVCRKYVDEGDMVGPTVPLLQVAEIDTVKVTGGVSERYLPVLAAGSTSAIVTVDACPGEQFEGRVYRAGPSIDPVTRTVEVEVRIPNADDKLKPGMFARLKLVLERRENVPVVPDDALLREGEKTFVFVVSDSTAHRRAVKLGLSQGIRHEVLEGLKPADPVVVRGQHMLKDGDKVRVVEEKQQ